MGILIDLLPWKRFMLLVFGTIVWALSSMYGAFDPTTMGQFSVVIIGGWGFYFITHKDQPAATCDTEDDPDMPPVVKPSAPSKTQIEMELAYGKTAVAGHVPNVTSTPGWGTITPLPKPENLGTPER